MAQNGQILFLFTSPTNWKIFKKSPETLPNGKNHCYKERIVSKTPAKFIYPLIKYCDDKFISKSWHFIKR